MAANIDLPSSPAPRNTLLALADAALQRSGSLPNVFGAMGATATNATDADGTAPLLFPPTSAPLPVSSPPAPVQDRLSLSPEARQRLAAEVLDVGGTDGSGAAAQRSSAGAPGLPTRAPGLLSDALPTSPATTLAASARAQAPSWPATGVAPPVRQLVQQLVDQLTTPVLSLRVLSLQPWTPALVRSLEADEGLPVLQTWLVHQGVVHTPDGPRGFALTLRLPLAWVEAQAASSPPSPPTGMAGAPAPAPLVFADRAQALPSMPLALVLQNAAAEGPAARTNALMVLEFQPLAQAAVYGREVAAPRLDPWVQMALLQASGQLAVEEEQARRRATALCDTPGCPYLGRATCVQPFCSAMRTVPPVVPAMDEGAVNHP